MSDITERYNKLKKEADEINRNKLLLEGKRKTYLDELHNLGYDSVESAVEKIEVLKVELEDLNNKISKELDEYEKEMEKVKNVL
jgi:uncharacterized membrane protein